MNHRSFLLIILVLLCFFKVNSQKRLSVDIGLRALKPTGGFFGKRIDGTIISSEFITTIEPFYSLAFDNTDTSKIGYSFRFTNGRKNFASHYPAYSYKNNLEEEVVAVGITSVNGFWMNYYELFMGANKSFSKYLLVRFGPYIIYNSKKELYPDGPRYEYRYSPFTQSSLFTRLEVGAQLHLNAYLPLGKHFNLQLSGLGGYSFNDLRKDKWENATVTVWEGRIFKMESDKLSAFHYQLSFGLGYQW